MTLPRIAAITTVRDEAYWLPRWVAHYSAQLGGPEHLHVLDDGSVDGSTSGLPCTVVPVDIGARYGFERDRMSLVSQYARRLLQEYDAVVLADADEFLVADPARHSDLRSLVAARPDADVLAAVGLNVVEHVGVDAPLAPGSGVLQQRSLAKFVARLCKPAIKRVGSRWRAASHGITTPYSIDPDLYLFHLKFADRECLRATAERRRVLVEADGRASTSSWTQTGDDLVALLDGLTGDVSRVTEFVPDLAALARIPQPNEKGAWVSGGRRQVYAMQHQPLVRVPARFRDSL